MGSHEFRPLRAACESGDVVCEFLKAMISFLSGSALVVHVCLKGGVSFSHLALQIATKFVGVLAKLSGKWNSTQSICEEFLKACRESLQGIVFFSCFGTDLMADKFIRVQ